MRGRDGFIAAFHAALRHFRIDPVSEVREIQVAGDLAYCWTHIAVTMTPVDNGNSRATQRHHANHRAQAGRRVGDRTRRENAGGGCMKTAVLLAVAARALCAQTVQVYSEFAQINDVGEVVAPANPREILSPAVARNAFSSFQIAIQVPEGTKFLVYVGQNPEDAARVTLYRRAAAKPGLERVELPYSGESSQVLWMDLWVDANAPVGSPGTELEFAL